MSDPRFSSLKTDPRFRRPRKHRSKVVLDDRFKDILGDEKKAGAKRTATQVDKYGRRVSETHERDYLRRFYRLEEEDASTVVDYARGAVLMESSDEDEDEAVPSRAPSEWSDSDDGGFVSLARDGVVDDDEDEGEIDLDENTIATLDAQVAAYTHAVPEGGGEGEAADVGRTRRLAVVNLDWDYVRAVHLFKIFSSLLSLSAPLAPAAVSRSGRATSAAGVNVARGKVLNVRVYPSEFGKKRMAREEKEGPPTEVFKKKKKVEEEDINEKTIFETGDEVDYDENALRKYQLERLRYYYAVVECDTAEAAAHVYNELEGTELERSANVFDLSFVPDEMTFDDEPRDEATQPSDAPYRAVEFVTDALRHSKVRLTWDEDDVERNHVLRRQLTKQEIDEADFRAYVASFSSSEEGSDDDEGEAKKSRSSKNEGKSSEKVERDRLRTLLLGSNDEDMPEGWGNAFDNKESRAGGGADSDVDMEVTFAPGLSEVKNPQDENTLEIYQRKKKEKRKKKKEEARKRAETEDDGMPTRKKTVKSSMDDEFFGVESDSQPDEEKEQEQSPKQSKKKPPKPERPIETSKAELALLAASDNPHGEPAHFDMKAILKAEKRAKNKSKHKSKKRDKDEADDGPGETQDDFVINVKDDRFAAIHEDHRFAIDPTNPQFKKTKSMTALLIERSKRQKRSSQSERHEHTPKSTKQDGRSLQTLVESVKRKSAVVDRGGLGKRRKLENS